jgi:23S rRNA pseudouridine955/2504/2580 synthase
MKETKVKNADADMRLDRWFQLHYPQVKHGELSRALRTKLVRLNGKRAQATDRLTAGDIIRHPEFEEGHARPAKPSLTPEKVREVQEWVIFKNKDVLAINKPAGLPTQGGSKQIEHVDGLLPALQFDAASPPRLVHRLDKDTSGVLLLARHRKAAQALMRTFAAKQVEKTYWALVEGRLSEQEGEIKLPLLKKRISGQERVVVDKQEGKVAITHFRRREVLGNRLSWVELWPLTGRTHQLRVHMEAIGHPIIGDGKYGGQQSFPEGLNLDSQLHLHAAALVMDDCLGKPLHIEAPLPPHMQRSWDVLGL